MNKKMFFVSNGRCGTTRIQEILNNHLDDTDFTVKHQMRYSRIANIIGNITYLNGNYEWVKEKIFKNIIKKYDAKKNFISTDPLTSMLIPQSYAFSNKVAIVHVVRESNSFANSFIKLSKTNFGSFVAHNLIPFWQISIFPFERIWNRNIKQKYINLNEEKNHWFEKKYSKNPNYIKINMKKLFTNNYLESIINDFFDTKIHVSKEELKIKSNATK